jgi:hypothetical protein
VGAAELAVTANFFGGNPMRKIAVTIAAAGLLVPGALLLAPAADAVTTPRAQQVRTTAAFFMTTPGLKGVQSLTLGTGSWTVVAKAFAVDLSGGGDIVRCQVFDVTHKKALDGAAAEVKPDYPGSMITNLAKLAVPSGATVAIQQRCGHDTDGGNPAYLDAGATLLAFKAKSAAGNRLARTMAQTPLGLSDSTVATLSLSAGTWLVGYKATAVSFDAAKNEARCGVEQAYASRWVGGGAGGTTVATVANFLTVTTSASRTISLTCWDYDGANHYLDPGSVLWARQVGSAVTGSTCGTVTRAGTADLVVDTRPGSDYCPVKAGAAGSQLDAVAVPAGTWVALGVEAELYSGFFSESSGDWLRCAARDVTHNKVIDPAATAWVPDKTAATTYAGLLQTTTSATVEFRCRVDGGLNGASGRSAYVLLRP